LPSRISRLQLRQSDTLPRKVGYQARLKWPQKAAKEATYERFVSATELARRIDVSRPYINKLESEGVLRRTPKGFPLDTSVIDYIRYLRREGPPSPRAAADAELAKAKARWLDLRVKEKEDLTPTCECEHIIDTAVGIVLTNLHSIPPRLFPLDIQERRRAERVTFEIRQTIADQCRRRAQESEAALVASERGDDTPGYPKADRR
jgi:DNA-binding XRE family transcriptional regulator